MPKNVLRHQHQELGFLVVHVVLDDDLHAEPHVIDAVEDEQQHDDRRRSASRGSAPPRRGCGRAARSTMTMQRDGQRNAGDRGDALMPEMLGAGCGPSPGRARGARRCACRSGLAAHRGPPMAKIADDPDDQGQRRSSRPEWRRVSQFALGRAQGRAACPRSDGGCRRACGGSAPRCSRTAPRGRSTCP